ncbi:MAG: hypothetical protein QXO70_04485 [Candidatus Pacearchaeota archaeon]
MESSTILLLYQLILAYEQSYSILENAYNKQDKVLFEEAKTKILEIQNKIDALIS